MTLLATPPHTIMGQPETVSPTLKPFGVSAFRQSVTGLKACLKTRFKPILFPSYSFEVSDDLSHCILLLWCVAGCKIANLLEKMRVSSN